MAKKRQIRTKVKRGVNCVHKNVVATVVVDIHWKICMRVCQCMDQLLLLLPWGTNLLEYVGPISKHLTDRCTIFTHPHPYHSGA